MLAVIDAYGYNIDVVFLIAVVLHRPIDCFPWTKFAERIHCDVMLLKTSLCIHGLKEDSCNFQK
jgi:hypothetical protein